MWRYKCLALPCNSAQLYRPFQNQIRPRNQLKFCRGCLVSQLLLLHNPAFSSFFFFFYKYYSQEQPVIYFLHATLYFRVCFLGSQSMAVGASSSLRNYMLVWDFVPGSLAAQSVMRASANHLAQGSSAKHKRRVITDTRILEQDPANFNK